MLEETGLELGEIRAGPDTDSHFPAEGKHHVTLFVVAESALGAPELREPAKCRGWAWREQGFRPDRSEGA